MRVVAVVLGALLFTVGLIGTVAGALGAFNRADNVYSGSVDWSCTSDNSIQRCNYGIGSVPALQVETTADVAVAVAGGALAICGVLFIAIGTRPTAPVPVQPAYGPPPAMGPPPTFRG